MKRGSVDLHIDVVIVDGETAELMGGTRPSVFEAELRASLAEQLARGLPAPLAAGGRVLRTTLAAPGGPRELAGALVSAGPRGRKG